MKKKLVAAMLMMMMAVGVTACGNETTPTNESTQKSSVEQSSEEVSSETPEESEEESKEADELPNWTGVSDYVGFWVVDKGGIGINICYPSLKPASSGWAYQKDPALVLATCAGFTEDNQYIKVTNIEDTFDVSKKWIKTSIENYRDAKYTDFDFIVESQEKETINELSTCKYIGKHTYNYDGVTQEIPFVAYAIDTKQLDEIYPIVLIVMDDSINNLTMEPLSEGTIEAYARKMVESITLAD